MILGIDHVGIAVRSHDAARTFETLLGASSTAPEAVPAQAVRVCFVPEPRPNLELLVPDSADASVARFVERRGEGLHHVCFAVDDLPAELARLTAAGFEPIDATPREGHGGLVAFLHPRSTHGVLVELLQRRP
ncbi:MAG TPA: VOC family protein [Chloroflexota bacterium]|nr:VOC family protein [Chloroflexota bacterium]